MSGNGTTVAGRPLTGRTVAVTRPRGQAKSFVRALEARGARAAVLPLIRINAPADADALDAAAGRAGAGTYDWIVFTSVNGVAWFTRACERAGVTQAALRGIRIACIGPATAGAARRSGFEPSILPDEYVAEAVVDAFAERLGGGDEPLRGLRLLLPRAAGARAVLRTGLEALGGTVDEVEAYRAGPDEAGAAALRRELADGAIDVLTFTASSTVDSFVGAVGADVGAARVAAIGPITAATARRHGLPVHIQAEHYTVTGLTDAICAYYSETGG